MSRVSGVTRCPTCGDPIVYIELKTGKLVPCDTNTLRTYDPVADAKVVIVTPIGQVGAMGKRFTKPTKGYRPHWSRCPRANDWRIR
jgi:ssDNA-binding Zn-finger/Zn-ribbon topoisomerase 1